MINLSRDNKILIMAGQGIGNVIQQSPLNLAIGSMFDNVDVVYAHPQYDYSDIMIGNSAYNVVDKSHIAPDKYDIVINTSCGNISFLDNMLTNSLKNKVIRWTNRPIRGTVNEVIENMTIAWGLGYNGNIPNMYCNKDNSYSINSIVDNIKLKKCVIQYDSSNKIKTYPYMNDVVTLLPAYCNVIVVGKDCVDNIEGKNIYNLCGKLSLLEYTSVISQSDIIIASDSSSIHIAAAFNKKVVGIFGPTSVVKNYPFQNKESNILIVQSNYGCVPCYPSYKCTYSKPMCLYSISPSYIVGLVVEKFIKRG